MYSSKEILEKYLNFFNERGHKQIPNVSLIPENDPSLLFVNSGMFPLVPYLSGEKHPLGSRLTNVQRSLRLLDIAEIGDSTHTLVFHMIGNWSLGDYFKKEQIPWIYEFFVEHLKLDPKRLVATVFAGDEDAPRDDESISLLQEVFKKYGVGAKVGERIFPYGKKSNWWKRGDTVGELGGPDSEIFYYLGDDDLTGKNPEDNEKEFLEIGNSVFMQYKKIETGWGELAQKNVDFGGGLERLALVVQGKTDIFETDNFSPLIEKIQEISGKDYYQNQKPMRVLADHMRASVFLAMDGVIPGNKDQGYVLRRLIRRMVRAGKSLGVEKDLSVKLVGTVIDNFSWLYPQLTDKKVEIEKLFADEETRFFETLIEGIKYLDKTLHQTSNNDAPTWAQIAFDMYQSLGYPQEILLEDLKERRVFLDEIAFIQHFDKLLNKHQEESRGGAEGKFKGGLADSSDTVVKYHTVTHLLQAGLKGILGNHVGQAGSNITGERFRFDFTNPQKLTEEELKKVVAFVNDLVDKKLPVTFSMMPKEEAVKSGAGFMAWETYPDVVKVYCVGDNLETAVSKEFCGGPHVSNTSELSHIEIFKQESIGKGKIRVYGKFI